jgi:hypothetical protein
MMIDTTKEVDRLLEVFRIHGGHDELGIMLAMEAVALIDRGMAMERERVVGIVQRSRNVIRPMEVVAEIRRPLR